MWGLGTVLEVRRPQDMGVQCLPGWKSCEPGATLLDAELQAWHTDLECWAASLAQRT